MFAHFVAPTLAISLKEKNEIKLEKKAPSETITTHHTPVLHTHTIRTRAHVYVHV